jgi:hypothetical protein
MHDQISKMWKMGKPLRFTLFLILPILFCDWYIFPLLFSNIVHSRYFSLHCGNKNESTCNELNKLFLNRYTNCKEKGNRYWMNQPRKLNTKSIVYDGLNRYWSKKMIEFLDHNKQPTLELLVMIVSVRRRKGSYLPHITRLLHQQIDIINSRKNEKNGKRDVDVIICNSDAEPKQNKEAVYLSSFVDVISINRTKRSHRCCGKETW